MKDKMIHRYIVLLGTVLLLTNACDSIFKNKANKVDYWVGRIYTLKTNLQSNGEAKKYEVEKAGIANETVRIDGSRKIKTDSEGYFRLGNVKVGKHRLLVSIPGYKKLDTTFYIPDRFEEEEFYLKKLNRNWELLKLQTHKRTVSDSSAFPDVNVVVNNQYKYKTNKQGLTVLGLPKGTYSISFVTPFPFANLDTTLTIEKDTSAHFYFEKPDFYGRIFWKKRTLGIVDSAAVEYGCIKTKIGVENAKVTVGNKTVRTNKKGQFKIFDLPDDSNYLKVEHYAFESKRNRIYPTESDSASLELQPIMDNYFSLKTGNSWTYNYNYREDGYFETRVSISGTLRWKVGGNKETDTAVVYDMRQFFNAKVIDHLDEDTSQVNDTTDFKLKVSNNRIYVNNRNKHIPLEKITNKITVHKNYPIVNGDVVDVKGGCSRLVYYNMDMRMFTGIGIQFVKLRAGGNTPEVWKIQLDDYYIQ